MLSMAVIFRKAPFHRFAGNQVSYGRMVHGRFANFDLMGSLEMFSFRSPGNVTIFCLVA